MIVDGAGPGVRRLLKMRRKKRTGRLDDKGHPEIKIEYTKLYKDISDSRLLTMSGLLSRVLHSPGGRNAVVKDYRDALPSVELPDNIGWRPGQKDAVETLLRNPQGRLIYPTGSGKTFILEQICVALKDQVIVMCTTRSTVLKDFIRRLKENTDIKPYLVNGSRRFKPGKQVYVVSAMSLHKLPEGWEPDIFIFDEAHGAAAPTVFNEMCRFKKCRMYGFTATDEGRSDGADLGIEALFGDRIAEMTYQKAEDLGLVVPMHVYFIDIAGHDIGTCTDAQLAYYGYTVNGVRNERMLIGADAVMEQGFVKQLFTTRTTEHALILSRMRPDIVPVYRPVPTEKWNEYVRDNLVDTTRHSREPDIDSILRDMRNGSISRIAGTTCLREGIDIKDLNVVVRMDGLSGKISNNQFAGRGTRLGKDYGIVLDSTDRFGQRMERAAQSRRNKYIDLGWTIYDWNLTEPPKESL